MHAIVLEEARSVYTSLRTRYAAVCATLSAAAPAASYLAYEHADATMQLAGGVGGGLVVCAVLAAVQGRFALQAAATRLASESELNRLFEALHVVEVGEHDEYVRHLWWQARPALQKALGRLALHELPKLSAAELASLDAILQQTVPELRRMTSPRASAVPPPPPPPPPQTAPPRASGTAAQP